MAFPTIPTTAANRLKWAVAVDANATRWFPDLDTLVKNPGDLLVAIVCAYQSGAGSAIWSGWGAGFTEILDVSAGASNAAFGIATRVCDGTETGIFSVTQAQPTGHAICILLSIPGVNPSTPFGHGDLASPGAAAVDLASFSSPWGPTDDILYAALAISGETSTSGSFTGISATPPTGYSMGLNTSTADVIGGISIGLAFKQTSTSPENPSSWTADTSSARNCGMLLAFHGIMISAPPSANAGPDQVVAHLVQVTLDSSASTDDVGITYRDWTQSSGQMVSLSDRNAVSPTFTSPDVDGDLWFTLTVRDADLQESSDTVKITVSSGPPPFEGWGVPI